MGEPSGKRSVSIHVWYAWFAALAFLAVHIAASAVPLLLGHYPSDPTLWALYYDFTKPFSLAWLPQRGIAAASYHLSLVFLAVLTLLLIVEVRLKTIVLSAILFAALWALSLLVFSNYLFRYLTADLSLETSLFYVKIAVVLLLGHFFYAGLRDIYMRRAAANRRRR